MSNVQVWFRQLCKDSVVYGVGGIISRSIPFLLIPVYTRFFSPGEYGTIEMFAVLAGLLGTLIGSGTDSAQSFYFFAEKERGVESQKRIVSAVLQWRMIWGGAVLILACGAAGMINRYFFNGSLAFEYFFVAFLAVFFSQIMSQSAEVFRLLYRPWSYIGINLANSVVTNAVIIGLLLLFKAGILGYLAGGAVGAATAAAVGWWWGRKYLDFSAFHISSWSRILRFGVPLMPAGLITWIMTTTDRWMVNYYLSGEDLGIYAVGAKFALGITVAIEIFRRSWWPVAMDAMHSANGEDLYRLIARVYASLSITGVILLAAIAPDLVRLFTPAAYQEAYRIIGILGFSAIFYGFLLISCAGAWKVEKTWWVTIALGIGAGTNIILSWFLVPIMGGEGAALSTASSMLLGNVILLLVGERQWALRLPYKVLAAQLVIGAATVAAILYLQITFRTSFLTSGFLGLVGCTVLLWLGLGKDGYAMIKSFYRNGGRWRRDNN